MKVILDCDCTIGIHHRDIDDALALLYLLGAKEVELVGITTSFGNGTQDEVFSATGEFLKRLDRTDIPLYRGCDNTADRKSAASEFIAATLRNTEDPVTIVATGALSNVFEGLRAAGPEISRTGLHQLVFMGGTIAPLNINGKKIKELNISCDPSACLSLLEMHIPTVLITGNLCLELFFSGRQERRFQQFKTDPLGKFIMSQIGGWMSLLENRFGVYGFHPWDLIAAFYTVNPGIFTKKSIRPMSRLSDLTIGEIKYQDSPAPAVMLPVGLTDKEAFWDYVFAAWSGIFLT